jgi:hypothetical protein
VCLLHRRCVVPGLMYDHRARVATDAPTEPIPNVHCHESCGECIGPTDMDCISCFNNQLMVSPSASDVQKLQPRPAYATVGGR